MKKKLFLVLGILLAAALCVVVYYETHFTSTELRRVSISEEKILKEVPDLLLTEQDRELLAALRQCPSVIAAAETKEQYGTSLLPREHPDLMEVFSAYLNMEQTEPREVYYLAHEQEESLLCMWEEEGDRLSALWWNFGTSYTKEIFLGRRDRNGEVDYNIYYRNTDGVLTKQKEHRIWFTYFRDRMWED